MSQKKILFLFSLVVFVAFVYFSFLVSRETFVNFDFDTTVKLQDHISRRWDLPFSLLSLLGSVEITGVIWLVLLLFLLVKRYWFTILLFPLFWAAMAFEVYGKLFLYHPGPPHLFYRGIFEFHFPSSYVSTDYSYPSGHLTRTSFLISFLILFLYFKVSPGKGLLVHAGLLAILALMAISRIYLGEHWVTDVIGGALLGSSVGIFTALTIPARKNASVQSSSSTV